MPGTDSIAFTLDLIKDLEGQLEKLREIKLPLGAAPAGTEPQLRAIVKQLEEKLEPLKKDLNILNAKIEGSRSRIRQIHTWNRTPTQLPYDCTKSDLETMEKTLIQGISDQDKKLVELRKNRDDFMSISRKPHK